LRGAGGCVAATETKAENADDQPEAAKALDKLFESGLLTKEEYEAKKEALSKRSVAGRTSALWS
jgi:hypothetical protein